jgi:AcrR family transcriptional regulator
MPRVVPEYKEQAKQRIIEAGARVFAERGYHQTRMDDIADALDVSKGAIYQYFKSKNQLFFEVVEFFLEARKDEILTIIMSEDLMQIARAEFFEMKVSRSLQTRSFGFDLLFEAAKNEKLRAKMTEVYERSYREFLQHIESMKNQGKIKRDADVGVVWRGLVALRDGLIMSILLGADVSDTKRTWVHVATSLLEQVLPPTGMKE